jgi:hypothetical protein
MVSAFRRRFFASTFPDIKLMHLYNGGFTVPSLSRKYDLMGLALYYMDF